MLLSTVFEQRVNIMITRGIKFLINLLSSNVFSWHTLHMALIRPYPSNYIAMHISDRLNNTQIDFD